MTTGSHLGYLVALSIASRRRIVDTTTSQYATLNPYEQQALHLVVSLHRAYGHRVKHRRDEFLMESLRDIDKSRHDAIRRRLHRATAGRLTVQALRGHLRPLIGLCAQGGKHVDYVALSYDAAALLDPQRSSVSVRRRWSRQWADNPNDPARLVPVP